MFLLILGGFKWCSANEYHQNFQSALEYRIPTEYEPRDSKLREPVKATLSILRMAKLLQFVWDHREDDYKFGLLV